MRLTFAFLICSALIMLAGRAEVSGATEDTGVKSMRWVKRVAVIIDITKGSEEFGRLVTPEGVRTAVELRLRQAGVDVAEPTDYSDNVGTLDISITGLPIADDPRYAIGVNEGFSILLWHQSPGKPREPAVATTWSQSSVFVWGSGTLSSNGASGLLKDEIDEFLNAWLTAHPIHAGTHDSSQP